MWKFEIKMPVFNPRAMAPIIERAMVEETRDVEVRYRQFFQTWDQKPAVRSKWTIRQVPMLNFQRYTEPHGDAGLIDIIRWLIYGTDPHIIEMTSKGYPMRWVGSRGSYKAKTDPGVISSHGGGFGNSVPIAAFLVEHPGITPRGTIAMINQERRVRLGIRFRDATERAIQAAIRAGVPR